MGKALPLASKELDRARLRRRLALGNQIRSLRGEVSQVDLGIRLAPLQPDLLPVPQSTISRWEKGGTELTAEQIHDIEAVLRVRPGTLFEAAGYVELPSSADDVSVYDKLRTMKELHPDLRENAITLIESFVKSSETMAREQGRPVRTSTRRG